MKFTFNNNEIEVGSIDEGAIKRAKELCAEYNELKGEPESKEKRDFSAQLQEEFVSMKYSLGLQNDSRLAKVTAPDQIIAFLQAIVAAAPASHKMKH